MDDEERLRQRIVLALDALPVPREAQPTRWSMASAIGYGDRSRGRLSVGWLPIAALLAVVAIFVMAPLVSTPGPPASAPAMETMSDDFALGIDRNRWVSSGTVRAVDGAVVLTIDADAVANPEGVVIAGLSLPGCVARGDYEVSLDFELLEWPPESGSRLVLAEFLPGLAGVSREQSGERETYVVITAPSRVDVLTRDDTGSLRLVRRGGTVVASYRSNDGEAWKDLTGQMQSQFDEIFQIALVAKQSALGGRTAGVAVDNFRLTASQLICR